MKNEKFWEIFATVLGVILGIIFVIALFLVVIALNASLLWCVLAIISLIFGLKVIPFGWVFLGTAILCFISSNIRSPSISIDSFKK